MNYVTMRLGTCGCEFIGDGTLPSPLEVEYCAVHAAAHETKRERDELLAAAKLVAGWMRGGYGDPTNNGSIYSVICAAIDRCER